MSFERTKGSIKNLSADKTISLDSMLDMLVCVTQDIYEHNGVKDAKKIDVDDQRMFLIKELNLAQMLLSVYEENKAGVSEFSVGIQDRYIKTIEDLEKAVAEISLCVDEIQKEETKKTELAKSHKRLRDERGYLLNIKTECEDLQNKIDILNDKKLDEMALEKEILQKEYDERQLKSEELRQQQASIKNNLNDFNERIKNLEEMKIELLKQTESLNEEEKLKLIEKEELEEIIEDIKLKLKEYQEWIDNFSELSKELIDNYEERKAEFTVILNALNSAKSDEFVMNTLFKIPDTKESLSSDNYPDYNVVKDEITSLDELREWFDILEQRIKGLIQVYGNMFKSLVKQSEKITSENNE